MNQSAIPGMVVAVIKNGQVILSKGYGYADIDNNIHVTEYTPFNIASISKPLLGIALMRLVDMDLLDLDEEINHYLPFAIENPKVINDSISVRNLATHTAGVEDYYDENFYAINKDAEISLSQHIKNLLTKQGDNYGNGNYFRDKPLGKERLYSNLGAGVAGLVLESISKHHLAEFSQQYILSP